MRKILALLALATAIVPLSATAKVTHHHTVHREVALTSGYYTNRAGHRVHRPMQSQSKPQGATARCRDGSWSFSESHRGTCSHHGGVASWL